jgi:hypothetical protein
MGLEANVVEQAGFGECAIADGCGLFRLEPPTEEMEQIIGVAAQAGFGKAAHSLLIQETVDPCHLLAVVLDNAEGTGSVSEVATLDQVKGHDTALSNSR